MSIKLIDLNTCLTSFYTVYVVFIGNDGSIVCLKFNFSSLELVQDRKFSDFI